MGEKEAGLATAREASSGMATGREASTGIATSREASSGMATGRASLATGEVDGDGSPDAADGAVVKSKSNISNNREASSGMATGKTSATDDWDPRSKVAGGDVDGDGLPDTTESSIVKSKSNITNNREAESGTATGGGDEGGGQGLAIGDQGTNNDYKPRPHH